MLPAGPTVVDMMANIAFFAGLVRALASEDRPIWTQMSFQAATDNFYAGVRRGIEADVYWPRVGQVPVTELVSAGSCRWPRRGSGLWGVPEAETGRLLGIIEQRCLRAANGATWQTAEVSRREAAGESRSEALRGMLATLSGADAQQRTRSPLGDE